MLLLVLAAIGLGVVLLLPVIRNAPLTKVTAADGRDQHAHEELDDDIRPKPE